jgi:hypothetical protein
MPRQSRLPILFALACALFLRALVPAGWMPAANGGVFAIEPCPAAEPQAHALMQHAGGKADHRGHSQQHDGDCAFSPLLTGLTLADLPAQLAQPSITAELPVIPSAGPAFKTGPPSPKPPATGPPALA